MRNYILDPKASFFSSLLFLLLHLPIVFFVLKFSGLTLVIYLFSVFVLSLVNCFLFRLRGSLLAPLLVHAFWNMTIALYL